jgi:protein SCO1/2
MKELCGGRVAAYRLRLGSEPARARVRVGCRLLLCSLMLRAVPAAGSRGDDALPPALRDVGIDQRLGEPLPLGLRFCDEAGKSVRLGDYFHDGKPVLLVLAYYRCPMLCTLVLNGLVKALQDVPLDAGGQFEVVAVSFDPRETPPLAAAKKAVYVEQYGRPRTERGWHFLTGDAPAIDELTRAVGFRYRYDRATDQFAHASGIMIATPRGKLHRYFYGVEYPAREIRLGLVEASEEKIGTAIDQVLLFCYGYSPSKGAYTLLVMNLVRAGGLATLAALVGFMLYSWRRNARAQARAAG